MLKQKLILLALLYACKEFCGVYATSTKNNFKLLKSGIFPLFSPPLKNKEFVKRNKNVFANKWTWRFFLAAKYSLTRVSGDLHKYKKSETANSCSVIGYHMVSYNYHLNRQTDKKRGKRETVITYGRDKSGNTLPNVLP